MLRFVLLALLAAVATSQQVAPCRCAAFLTTEIGEEIVYELPPVEVHSCDQNAPCRNRCSEEFTVLSGGGDLDYITSDNVTTVGQVVCSAVEGAVDNQFVYAYSELCEGPWEWTGDQTMQKLCCDEAGVYAPCA